MSQKRKVLYKNPQQIEAIREAGKYLTELLGLLYDYVKPGQSLIDLEMYAESYIKKHKLLGAFKGYNGFPANLCLSVNDCLVHGIPDGYILKSGDLLKVDCGITYKKGIADAAFSIVVGGSFANPEAEALIEATRLGLDHGLQYVQPGKKIFEFSSAVESFINQKGYSVVENLTGHGVGIEVHEPPYIYNFPHPETKKYMFEDTMVVALEPITAFSSYTYREQKPKVKPNGRNLYTQGGDNGAQREYTVLITATGHEVLAGLQK